MFEDTPPPPQHRRHHSSFGLVRRWRALLLWGVSLATYCPAALAHVTAPEVLESPTAEWPAAPETHDVVVPVLLTVDETGAVTQVEFEASLGPEWDAAARAAALSWKFTPAKQDGEPHPARVRALIRFVAPPKSAPAPGGAVPLPVPEQTPPVTSPQHGASQNNDHAPGAAPPSDVPPRAPLPSEAASGTRAGPNAPSSADNPPDTLVSPTTSNLTPVEQEPTPPTTTEVTVRGAPAPYASSTVSVPRAVLSAAPHPSGSDLLRTVPGVFISQHSGEGKAHQIFFRGYDAVHGQDLAIDVAGAPVNEVSNIHGQGYADLHFLIPEVVERISVLPGPFAPSQGDFAVSGSLHFDLGVNTPGLTTLGSYGQFDTRRLLFVYHPESAPSTTFGAAEVYETAGFGTNRAASRANALAQHVVTLSEHDQVRFFASVHSGRFESPGVVRLRDVERGDIDRFGTYDPNQGGFSSRSQALAEWSTEHTDWQLRLSPYVSRRTLRLRYNYTGALTDPPELDNTLQSQGSTTFGIRAAYSRRLDVLDGKTQLTAGLEGRHDDIEQAHRFTSADAPLVDALVDATHVGGWLELANSSLERVSVRAGLRFDNEAFAVTDRVADVSRSSQGTRLGPKASLQLLITPELVASLAYGSGFRSPQARGLADGERTPFTDVQAFEGGARWTSGNLSASLAAFASYLEQDLVFNETTSRNDPVQATRRLGATADARWLHPDWLASCNLTFTRATFREDGPRYLRDELVPYVPQWVGRCDAGAHHELFEFGGLPAVGRLGGALNVLAQRPLPYGETGSTYVLTDVSLGVDYSVASLRLDVTNVLDATWNDSEFVYSSAFPGVPASSIPERHVTAGAPRLWLLSLSVRL